MKRLLIWCVTLCGGLSLMAQSTDPVIMRINGKDVLRSEFEYSFNKNNGDNVVDKKSVEEYKDLFINYKLKVEAALDAHYDTLTSFKQEFATYKNQQIRPYFVLPEMEEQEIRNYYDAMQQQVGLTGLVLPAHIMVALPQRATKGEQRLAKAKIDSIYTVLQGGAEFGELARTCSADKGSAARGGELGWVAKGQLLKEFDDKVFSMQKGEVSEPFLTTVGYHIVLIKDVKQLEPYEELRQQIKGFLEQRGLKDRVAMQAITAAQNASGERKSVQEVLDAKAEELCKTDLDLKYLIQEYHDGLLLFEISSREVWDKASKDEAGLAAYFKANKKKYKWDAPRYKGVAYHCLTKDLESDIRKLLKKVDESLWIDTLRACYNRDSVQQIWVEKNLFKAGDNAWVDYYVFKSKKRPEPMEKLPYSGVYGKKLKAPKHWTDVRGEVISDYQTKCEKEFVESLRKKYKVEIVEEVINTVNKH